MLAYVLALAVGIGSIALYLAAFFFPEIHKKNDFIWSGVGFFYALVLWIFARKISGGLLLGHIASVSLLYWFGWQAFTLRRQVIPVTQQTPLPSTEELKAKVDGNKLSFIGKIQTGITGAFSGAKNKAQETIKKAKPQDTTSATASPEQIIDALTEEAPAPSAVKADVVNSTIEIKPATTDVTVVDKTRAEAPTAETKITEPIPPNPPSPELVEAAQATEEVAIPPVEEIAPDAVLAPPAEPPAEPTPPAQS
jgi:cytoskeletal protein RodZ